MITEKHGRTTVYKCGKRFDKKKETGKYTMEEIDEIADNKAHKPESKPDKKKYKNSGGLDNGR